MAPRPKHQRGTSAAAHAAADALGADVLLLGSIAVIGEETVFGLKRLDQKAARKPASPL